MDGQRIDGLARALARRASRRTVLRGVAAAAAAGAVARGSHYAAAQGGCGEGLTDCGGSCVDLSADMANCGACGAICESSLVGVACIAGECVRTSCPAALPLQCGETAEDCVDPMTDPTNCGGCGIVCGGECIGGLCGAFECGSGNIVCGGFCANPSVDPNNCGGCGIVCGDGLTCFEGVCDCPGGQCGEPEPEPQPEPTQAPVVALPNTGSGGADGSDGSGWVPPAVIAAAAAGAAAMRRLLSGVRRSESL